MQPFPLYVDTLSVGALLVGHHNSKWAELITTQPQIGHHSTGKGKEERRLCSGAVYNLQIAEIAVLDSWLFSPDSYHWWYRCSYHWWYHLGALKRRTYSILLVRLLLVYYLYV